MKFEDRLKAEIIESGKNYYTDNYDYLSRPPVLPPKKKAINFAKMLFFKKWIFSTLFKSEYLYRNAFLGRFNMTKYLDKLDNFYNYLEDQASKDLLVKLITFRTLGYLKVKLPFHTPNYWEELRQLEASRSEKDVIELPFNPWKLYLHDLKNYDNFSDLKMYFSTMGVYSSIVREHYKHWISKTEFIGAEKGDVVLDLGGCFGDTAIYFADIVGEKGKVYSFEFIPGSIEIFNKNLDLNPNLKPRVEIVKNPLWNKTGLDFYFEDRGGGSQVSSEKFEGYQGTTVSTTLDDFIKKYNVEAVDFIKTDIEGAEPFAIAGATETIKRFKPKLAISIYHGMEDFVNIVESIRTLDLGYKFYLGHASIYASETVLFCQAR